MHKSAKVVTASKTHAKLVELEYRAMLVGGVWIVTPLPYPHMMNSSTSPPTSASREKLDEEGKQLRLKLW